MPTFALTVTRGH